MTRLVVRISTVRLNRTAWPISRVKVAAVGPIVAGALRETGISVDMMPEESYFMKPLVNAIVAALSPKPD